MSESVWNRIGNIATNLGKFGKDLIVAPFGAAKFAWDIGTAPWNDKAEYNGFMNTIKTAASGSGKVAITPLADAAGAIMKVPFLGPALEEINKINRNYIRKPLTTFALMQGDINRSVSLLVTEGLGAFEKEVRKTGLTPSAMFDPKTYSKYYKLADEISPGQAILSSYRALYDPKFDIYNPSERDAAFKQSSWGWALSGTLDLGINLVGDVTLVGGKVVSLTKASKLGVGKLTNSEMAAKAAEEITRAQAGEANRFTKVLEDFTNNNSTYAISHPMVKSSSNPGLLAHLLGDSTDIEETGFILRSALGDPVAMDELTLQRAYITDALKTARADLSIADEHKLFAAPDESGMIPFLSENEAAVKEVISNYESLAKTDKYFADLMEIGKGGGALTRTTGKLGQGIEDFIAKSRAVKFYDKKTGNPRVEIYQPTPFHKLYQKFSWGAQERPAGIVDFNDPDSYKEIIATVNDLNRILDLSPTQSKSILDSYMQASTPEARSIAVINLEGAAFRRIAQKYDIEESEATKIYNQYKKARITALKSIKDKGFMIDTDGSVIKVPLFESQTANYLPVMDFALMDRLLKRNASGIRAVAGRSSDRIFSSADFIQDAFKAGALLRTGYTIRNGIDSQLRIAASVGAFASLRHLGPGLKNVLNNSIDVPSRYIDRYRVLSDGMTYSELQKTTNRVIKELDKLNLKIDNLAKKANIRPDDLDVASELTTTRLLQQEKLALYNHYSEVLSKRPAKKPKARIGTGTFKHTTSDGQTYEIFDAYGGPLGDMFRRTASSSNSFERMVDGNFNMTKRKLSYKGIGAIRPTDPAYFEQWAQTLRQQFGNSAVVNKIVAGESIDDIATWLRNSPDGRNLRKRLAIESDDSVEYVTRISGFLDQYLPLSSGLRGKIKEVTAEDLRAAFKDPTELPIIHGHVLEENILNSSKIEGRKLVNSAFRLLGTLPEDAWARNPLYIYLYRREAARRLDVMTGLKKDRLTIQEQNELMSASHKIALREMKGILFNIERKTNLATVFKYISPFFSAQENAYKTWMKLAVANPAIVNRGYLAWNAPNQAGLVTDFDGNIVPPGQTSGNDIIWISLPKPFTKIPGLQSLTEMGIPKGSLDIIFQGGMDVLYMKGNPNVFSDIFPVGPYIAVPISELVKKKPSLEDAFKWALPYGPAKTPLSAFLPAWAQRAEIAAAGLDDPQFARTYQLIWNTEQQNAKRNGQKPVSPEKILKMTQDYWKMRIVANLILPFAPRFDSPYRFYIEKSREYKRLYGVDADSKFLEDYPEFFSFTASLSKNPTNVQSSIFAIDRINKYSGLVGDLSKIEPRLIGAITNDFAGYDFSQAAYNYLYKKRISPDSPERFLSSQSPAESQKKLEAEKGWIQYNKLMDAIDNELQDRGLSSTQQKGAEDLAAVKTAMIDKLAIQRDADGNPVIDEKTGQYKQTAWYDDYLDSDGSKTNRVILGLGTILSNKKFLEDNKNNVTWKSVGAYLDFRKAVAAELSRRDKKSISAKSNADIKFAYDIFVNKLKQDDKLGFAYIYDRFLSQDLVYDKYLTPKKETK